MNIGDKSRRCRRDCMAILTIAALQEAQRQARPLFQIRATRSKA